MKCQFLSAICDMKVKIFFSINSLFFGSRCVTGVSHPVADPSTPKYECSVKAMDLHPGETIVVVTLIGDII